MGATNKTHKRKPPQQQRSEAMVERIVDAGSRVLLRDGYDATSTNKIALEAEVSPGSLYYYFSDKDGVVGAVLDRFLKDLAAVVGSHGTLSRDLDRSTFLRSADGLLSYLEQNRRLLDVLVNEAPGLVGAETRAAIEHRLQDQMRLAFILLGSPLSGEELDARCWLAAHLCLAIPVRYVLNAPAIPRALVIDGLADQIHALAGLDPRSP
ncbi:MAG TPA: TetR/AcrR family transcriptional regulator [Nocardioidaceae bacterium]|nr:TetR/AcrR family transcriptional regulator [Nocardioidaceae bacterium]